MAQWCTVVHFDPVIVPVLQMELQSCKRGGNDMTQIC
jgi:hypothetical protein